MVRIKKIWGIVELVGVGKTTLTKTLCEHFNATAVFEEWENNPYLIVVVGISFIFG